MTYIIGNKPPNLAPPRSTYCISQLQNGLKWATALEISFCCSAGQEFIIYLPSFVPHENFLPRDKYCMRIPPMQQKWSVILMHSKLCILLRHVGQRLMRTFHSTKFFCFFFSLLSLFLSNLVHPAHNYSQKKRRKKGSTTLLPLRNPEKTGCLLDCLDAKRLPEVQRAPGTGPAPVVKVLNVICWSPVQGYRSACVCGKHFTRPY